MSKQDVFAALRQRTSINDLAALLDIELTPDAKDKAQMRGSCPRCDVTGKKSLAINTNRQKFTCWFGAGDRGDVTDLFRHVKGLSDNSHASKELAAFLDAPPEQATVHKEAPSANVKLQSVLDKLIPTHEKIEHFGLSKETCEHFQSGYMPGGTMTGRFLIALHTPAGELVGFVGVATRDDQQPRFLYPQNFDRRNIVFNIHRVSTADCIMVATDPLEVLQAFENGDEYSIAFLDQ